MAHFNMPPGGDPDTVAWLQLPRKRRRAAWSSARRDLRGPGTIAEITKAQRRAATPWQPIVVPPGDAHFLSGRPNQDAARLILLGLNRRERRALKSKGGPRHEVMDYATGHAVRSERRTLPLLSRLGIYARAEQRRRGLAKAQGFQGSALGKVARGAALAAAVPVVAARKIGSAVKGLFRRFAE
jgi:hypothetical protein